MNKFLEAQPQSNTRLLPKPGILQRKCRCDKRTSVNGACQGCGKQTSLPRKALTNSRLPIQTKLSIGASDDSLETEANGIADQVLAPPSHADASSAPLHIQRSTHHLGGEIGSAPASVDRVIASPGVPLNATLRLDMEQRFGHDFSQVRIHSGAAAEQSARDVDALAYTVGPHIVFSNAQFASGTQAGRRLIAHELTHVVQQGGAASTRLIQRQPTIGANAVPQDAAAPSEEKQAEASTCPAWFGDPESISKRAAEHYVRNELMPPSQAVVEKVTCEKPATNGNYACTVQFSDGLVIRVLVLKQEIVVGVPPFNTMKPPANRPMCFYNYACPQDDLILTKRECRSSK